MTRCERHWLPISERRKREDTEKLSRAHYTVHMQCISWPPANIAVCVCACVSDHVCCFPSTCCCSNHRRCREEAVWTGVERGRTEKWMLPALPTLNFMIREADSLSFFWPIVSPLKEEDGSSVGVLAHYGPAVSFTRNDTCLSDNRFQRWSEDFSASLSLTAVSWTKFSWNGHWKLCNSTPLSVYS